MKRLIPSWVIGLLALGALLLATGGSRAIQAAPAVGPPACDPGWQLVASPSDAYIGGPNGVAALAPNDVWVVGGGNADAKSALIMHWDGQRWHGMDAPGGINYYLIGIDAAAPNDIWAVGYIPDTGQPVTIHWNGLAWQWVPVMPAGNTPYMQLYRVAAQSSHDAWAVGTHSVAGVSRRLILHWDGTQWSVAYSEGNPIPGPQYLRDVSASGANDAWAVGEPDANGNQVLHWDGAQWTPVAVPFAGTFNGVTANAPNDVWIVGGDGNALILHWDGTSWTRLPNPSLPGMGSDVWNIRFAAANDGWATGTYAHRNYPSYEEGLLLLHWDGVRWTRSTNLTMIGSRLGVYGLAAVGPDEAWAVGWGGGRDGYILAHWVAACLTGPAGAAPTN